MEPTLTSFYFLCFLTAVILLYYLIPQRFQWIILLLGSIAYYLLSGNGVLIAYPLISSIIIWGFACLISKRKSEGYQPKILILSGVIISLLPLFILKYINFLINTINGLAVMPSCFGGEPIFCIPNTRWLLPLGISFYTFTMLGYLIDVYNGIAAPQKNLFKFLTFGMYFPTILSGPIMKYREDGEQFFTPHKLDYRNLTFGAQRILWGFFKALVISERAKQIVNSIYDSPGEYRGFYVIIGTFCYAIELYTNFSGGMDIVLGISEMLGLRLPENFERPFFTKTISEYWRRWHITLGVWMKEYVFYPLLRTAFLVNLQKRWKKHFGKKLGKLFSTFVAMFILWFTVGIWHGGDWKYVIGSGLLHWLYIVFGQIVEEPFDRLMTKLGLNSKAGWLDVLRVIRTLLLVCLGFVFFRASSVSDAVKLIVSGFSEFNPEILIDGSIFNLGLNWVEFVIFAVSLALLITVSAIQTKRGSVRELISKLILPIRWLLWFALLFFTILMAYYGPGYSAQEFIYQGF